MGIGHLRPSASMVRAGTGERRRIRGPFGLNDRNGLGGLLVRRARRGDATEQPSAAAGPRGVRGVVPPGLILPHVSIMPGRARRTRAGAQR